LVKCIASKNEIMMNIYNILSLINRVMGNYAIALQQQEKALQVANKILPQQHPSLLALYVRVGNAYSSLTDYEIALDYYKQCHTIYEQILSPLHPDLANLYLNMGNT
jgi:tetratricopeptide (TPR) repeat protein